MFVAERREAPGPRPQRPTPARPAPLLALQRQAGNTAVAQRWPGNTAIVQRQAVVPPTPPPTVAPAVIRVGAHLFTRLAPAALASTTTEAVFVLSGPAVWLTVGAVLLVAGVTYYLLTDEWHAPGHVGSVPMIEPPAGPPLGPRPDEANAVTEPDERKDSMVEPSTGEKYQLKHWQLGNRTLTLDRPDPHTAELLIEVDEDSLAETVTARRDEHGVTVEGLDKLTGAWTEVVENEHGTVELLADHVVRSLRQALPGDGYTEELRIVVTDVADRWAATHRLANHQPLAVNHGETARGTNVDGLLHRAGRISNRADVIPGPGRRITGNEYDMTELLHGLGSIPDHRDALLRPEDPDVEYLTPADLTYSVDVRRPADPVPGRGLPAQLRAARQELAAEAPRSVSAALGVRMIDSGRVVLWTRPEVLARFSADFWTEMGGEHPKHLGFYNPNARILAVKPACAQVMGSVVEHEAVHWAMHEAGMSMEAPTFDMEFPAWLTDHGFLDARRAAELSAALRGGGPPGTLLRPPPRPTPPEQLRDTIERLYAKPGKPVQAGDVDMPAYAAQAELKLRRLLHDVAHGRRPLAAHADAPQLAMMTVPHLEETHGDVMFRALPQNGFTGTDHLTVVVEIVRGPDEPQPSVAVNVDLTAGELTVTGYDFDALAPDRRLLPDGRHLMDIATDLAWDVIAWPDEAISGVARTIRVGLDEAAVARVRARLDGGARLPAAARPEAAWQSVQSWAGRQGAFVELLRLDGTDLVARVMD